MRAAWARFAASGHPAGATAWPSFNAGSAVLSLATPSRRLTRASRQPTLRLLGGGGKRLTSADPRPDPRSPLLRGSGEGDSTGRRPCRAVCAASRAGPEAGAADPSGSPQARGGAREGEADRVADAITTFAGFDGLRLAPRHLVRVLDRLWRRGLSVRPVDDDRLARGDLRRMFICAQFSIRAPWGQVFVEARERFVVRLGDPADSKSRPSRSGLGAQSGCGRTRRCPAHEHDWRPAEEAGAIGGGERDWAGASREPVVTGRALRRSASRRMS